MVFRPPANQNLCKPADGRVSARLIKTPDAIHCTVFIFFRSELRQLQSIITCMFTAAKVTLCIHFAEGRDLGRQVKTELTAKFQTEPIARPETPARGHHTPHTIHEQFTQRKVAQIPDRTGDRINEEPNNKCEAPQSPLPVGEDIVDDVVGDQGNRDGDDQRRFKRIAEPAK